MVRYRTTALPGDDVLQSAVSADSEPAKLKVSRERLVSSHPISVNRRSAYLAPYVPISALIVADERSRRQRRRVKRTALFDRAIIVMLSSLRGFSGRYSGPWYPWSLKMQESEQQEKNLTERNEKAAFGGG